MSASYLYISIHKTNVTIEKCLLLLCINFRMGANHSQIGNTPSQSLSENIENEANRGQTLSVQTLTTSQPWIQFKPTNMIPSQIPLIPHVQEHQNVSRRQLGRQRRRQKQRQRREQRTFVQRPHDQIRRDQKQHPQRRHDRIRQYAGQPPQKQQEHQHQEVPQVRNLKLGVQPQNPSKHHHSLYHGFQEFVTRKGKQFSQELNSTNRQDQPQLIQPKELHVPEQLELIQHKFHQLHLLKSVQKFNKQPTSDNSMQLMQTEK